LMNKRRSLSQAQMLDEEPTHDKYININSINTKRQKGYEF